MREKEEDEKLTLWVLSLSELVLLVIRNSEDVVSYCLNGEYTSASKEPDVFGVLSEVISRVGIGERNPEEISDGKHESETIGSDVL